MQLMRIVLFGRASKRFPVQQWTYSTIISVIVVITAMTTIMVKEDVKEELLRCACMFLKRYMYRHLFQYCDSR